MRWAAPAAQKFSSVLRFLQLDYGAGWPNGERLCQRRPDWRANGRFDMANFRGIVLAFAGCISAITGAVAQDAAKYPEQLVRVIVPFSAGSMTDLLARVIADKLQQRWNKDVIVENRPGLAGTSSVAKASCRRLHADAHLQRPHRHQPSQQEPGVRSDQGLRGREPGCDHTAHPGGASRTRRPRRSRS